MTNPPSHSDAPAAGATLAELLDTLPGAELLAGESAAARATAVADLTLDSRAVQPGWLFACRPGLRVDGHDHAPAAAGSGAAALLVERPLDVALPQVRVPCVADAVGPAAAAVHGHPAQRLALCGITGTNGKTTSTYLVEAAMRAAGWSTGLIGTVQTLVAGQAEPGVRTTPEAPDLHRLLRRMADAGVRGAAMEVSSHGLALGRVRATRFAVVVFTNLSQDHLDFHRDLDEYFAAKASLFDPSYSDRCVVNVDDAHGRRLAAIAAERGLEVTTVSAADPAADVHARDVTLTPKGSAFTAVVRGTALPVRLRLPGAFNVLNALCALAALERLGLDPGAAAAGLEALAGVPGRMEPVEAGQPFAVLVDYAHTPEGLRNVLQAARAVTGGRVLVVVGCGGDRDRTKRPLMGRAAVELADVAVLTSDNPRSEDPMAIIAAMEAGAREVVDRRWLVEPSRAEAIRVAIEQAAAGDVVVIAGKGHETTQEFADVTVAFDDRTVARGILEGGAASAETGGAA